MSHRPKVVLATDSPAPSGVGRHMLMLAGALGAGWDVRLAFPDHAAGRALAADAAAMGLCAHAVTDGGWPDALAGAQLVHVHAGIGWEGHGLIAAARAAGARTVRTEHLPWLITDPRQRDEYAAMIDGVDGVVAVSEAAADGWRAVLRSMPGPRLPLASIPNGVAFAPLPRRAAPARAAEDTPGPSPAEDADPPYEPVSGMLSAAAVGPHQGLGAGAPIDIRPGRIRRGQAHRGTARGAREAAGLPMDGHAPPGPVLLCIARFTPQKNHRTLLAAFARLRLTHPGARLQLVGTGAGFKRACLAAARLGLPPGAIAFLGERRDIPALMAAADLLVLPSSFEGLPLVVLEAMAAGLPVVASRIGGVIEALGDDHPWLPAPRNPRALAGALAEALGNPDARAAVASAQARRFADHYTATRMGDQTARLYTAVLRGTRGTTMTTRLGFIGAGGIAHRHFGVLELMEDVRVVAVADPDQGRAEEAARRMGARAFTDAVAMLDGAELDAVFICVPPFAHGEAERACLARALPFFVEKPLSLDLALAEEIAAEVEKAGLITAVGYHWRYLDTVDEARRILGENPPQLMTGFWLDQTPPPQWWWREDASGGQVVEQATHIIDLARFLAGDVTEVFALASRKDRGDFEGLTVPTATTANLRFASGTIANLAATCLLRWNHRVGLHVYADALAMEITDHDLMVDVGHGRPIRRAEGDPVWREDRDFIDAVQGRENRIRCPYAEALETHRVALAISKSAAADALVKMEVLRSNPQPFFRPASA